MIGFAPRSGRLAPFAAGTAAVILAMPIISWAQVAAETPVEERPVVLSPGPQLLIDDYLISQSQGTTRRVNSAERFREEPVVTGSAAHQNWQPFLTVLHDPWAPPARRFRMWYNVDTVDDPRDGEWFGATGHLESSDGVHWPGPYKKLTSLAADGRVRFGASVLDEGPRHPIPAERFKMLYFDAGDLVGPRVAFSADGLEWTANAGGKPIMPKAPSDDIWTAGFDPYRKRYFLIGKQFGPFAWTNAEGESLNLPIRRYFTSFSQDFKSWTDFEGCVYSPDERDPGVTQWYGAAGFLARGGLIVGFLRVLRDDLTASGAPPEAIAANNGGAANLGSNLLGTKGGAGMGYTVLTWTRDGKTWHRDRHTDAFLQPNPAVGAWDHAMAWVGSAVPVGDELFLYYAGYRWGHKYRHSVDRQIGLVKIPRDRLVAREAGSLDGLLTTRPIVLDGDELLLNVDARGGRVQVRLTEPGGAPYAGFDFDDCRPISEDSLAATVAWPRKPITLRGKPVRLQFKLARARLYAFEIR
jgi:hypothetical protein